MLEGADGAGKSTQARLLAAALAERGLPVEHLRDPGGTAVGDRVREVLLHAAGVAPRAETFLFLAARAQMVAERIAPALAAGRNVVCERFSLSTVVYQGRAAGLEGAALDALRGVVAAAAADVPPDLVLVLDVPPGEGLRRKGGGAGDRIEARGDAFQERVRAGYLEEARRDAAVVVVPAGPPEAVAARVLEETLRAL